MLNADMARPIRVEYAGAVYHVMARGNQGQKLCADDGDRKMWLATVGEACRRTDWRIHAWALMGNHFHLLGEAGFGVVDPRTNNGQSAVDRAEPVDGLRIPGEPSVRLGGIRSGKQGGQDEVQAGKPPR